MVLPSCSFYYTLSHPCVKVVARHVKRKDGMAWDHVGYCHLKLSGLSAPKMSNQYLPLWALVLNKCSKAKNLNNLTPLWMSSALSFWFETGSHSRLGWGLLCWRRIDTEPAAPASLLCVIMPSEMSLCFIRDCFKIKALGFSDRELVCDRNPGFVPQHGGGGGTRGGAGCVWPLISHKNIPTLDLTVIATA